jgi:hypothetical protein
LNILDMKNHLIITEGAKVKFLRFVIFLFLFESMFGLFAQTPSPKNKILIDIAHKQRFFNDPERMTGMAVDQVKRMVYVTNCLNETASSVDGELSYISGIIEPSLLASCKLLFIHTPASMYTVDEVKAIIKYVRNGGSLFLVMDEDYWSTLKQTNVNDIIRPFGIQYGQHSPDTLVGGYTDVGVITSKKLKIAYATGRIVMGGTPFCFSNQTREYPFGTYKVLKNGGKIIVMGDGMTSLYMTNWKDVTGFQCMEFMHDTFYWLLR